jgi:hypothetical protein
MVAPLELGAVHDKLTWLSPAVATTVVGEPGTPAGVTAGDESADGRPEPTALVAVTVNVYGVPLTSPSITWVVAADENGWGGWATPPMNGVTM